MKDFWSKVLSTVVAGALIGNVAMLFSIRERITRLEAKIEAIEKIKFVSK
jgi:hypothetical protein